jgi:hypothetical protein
LPAVDFFTVEVWTAAGLTTYYVLTVMRLASRQVCVAGITTSPERRWMEQMARNLTFDGEGFLWGCRYLLHDRDIKFCAAFDGILETVGIQVIKLPPQTPNLNAYLERWHRSVQRGMPIEVYPVRGSVAATRAPPPHFAFSHRTESPRKRQRDLVSDPVGSGWRSHRPNPHP